MQSKFSQNSVKIQSKFSQMQSKFGQNSVKIRSKCSQNAVKIRSNCSQNEVKKSKCSQNTVKIQPIFGVLINFKSGFQIFLVLIKFTVFQDRIEKIANDIFTEVVSKQKGEGVHAICVLKGGYRFFSDLLNKINALNTSTVSGGSGATGESVQISIEFIRIKSYLNDR